MPPTYLFTLLQSHQSVLFSDAISSSNICTQSKANMSGRQLILSESTAQTTEQKRRINNNKKGKKKVALKMSCA